jgi:lycopene cyclase CruP
LGGGWLPPDQINRLLRCNFTVLRALGAWVLRPFLTDTFRALPLALTMMGMSLVDPMCVLRSMRQVGPGLVLSWVRHFFALTLFTLAHAVVQPLVHAVPLLRRSWRMRRWLDAWRWGAGLDYNHPAACSAAATTPTATT